MTMFGKIRISGLRIGSGLLILGLLGCAGGQQTTDNDDESSAPGQTTSAPGAASSGSSGAADGQAVQGRSPDGSPDLAGYPMPAAPAGQDRLPGKVTHHAHAAACGPRGVSNTNSRAAEESN